MNERLNELLEKMKSFYGALSPKKKMALGITAILAVVGVMATTIVMKHDPQQVLYSDLHQEDAKAIAKKLSEQNIAYRVSDDSRTISVAQSQVYKARMELAKEGLPGQDVVGFEKFDATSIGMSSYVQRIQYIRAIQGELTRSIQRLASVKTARVHISIPPKKVFMEEEEPPKASVILELKPGMSPTKIEVNGIANLVASAVEGLKVGQVTIVDTKGNFLHRPGDESAPSLSSSFLELQRSIEAEYEKRVEEILTPVVGFGKVRAKVTAEIDPSRVNTTEETYDSEKAVPRQTLKTEETISGSRPNPVGIPGSRSNLPGAEAQNPQIPLASSNTEKSTNNTSYAIPKKVQVVDKPSGNIKRMTVAVVVDGYYTKGAAPNSPDVFSPRPEAELKRLQDLVANAVGFDQERRDSITISSLPFSNIEVTEPIETPKPWYDLKELSEHGIRNGMIALVVMMFFFLILRPFLKWTVASEEPSKGSDSVPDILPKTVSELESVVRAEALPPAMATNEGVTEFSVFSNDAPENAQENITLSENNPAGSNNNENATGFPSSMDDKAVEEDLKAKILERLQNSPKKGFRIVQEWLDEMESRVAEG
ncbi:MAG: flagellar M-ring protein FliF [Proteobacteria bacterium]|nr:flagellar M-ring protein FliF [Pseudomonadota bacterium]